MKAKKTMAALLCIVVSFVCATFITACAKENSAGKGVPTEGLEYTLSDDGTYYICSSIGSATATDITIPSQYNDKPVTSIGYRAFYERSGLTSVTIPDCVTSIGERAFYGCSSLTSFTMPSGVTSIGSGAFDGCVSLQFNEYDNVLYLGNSQNPYMALIRVKDLRSAPRTIHADTRLISSDAFLNCRSITSITIPNSVTSIGDSAFSGCSSLKKVNITDIAAWCKISFGNQFANPLNYTHNLYLNDVLVTELTIPEGVTCIGNYAFYGCTSLTSITIPSGVTSIGDRAFFECSNLTSITIPDSVTSIGDSAFEDCRKLTYNEYDNAAYLGNSQNPYVVFIWVIDQSITSIHNDTRIIYEEAFSDCSVLTSITIPSSVTSIGRYAFRGCSSLTSITVEEGNTKYYSAGNCLIETATKKLIAGCKNSIIPDEVTSIEIYSFYGCSGLTSITIPNSVTSIGGSAFVNCFDLTSVTIGSGVTSIGGAAFSGCGSLMSVTIPSSVTSIGDWAFDDCDDLRSITFNGTVAQWQAISKGSNWNSNTGNYTITCSDGKLSKDGTVTMSQN